MKKYTIENNISELFKVAAIISAIIGGIKDIDELHKFIDLLLERYDVSIKYNIVFYKDTELEKITGEQVHNMYIRFTENIGGLELILTDDGNRFMGDK